ncbi:MAG: magnesium/cobalt transporter CorA [Candidatus Kapaibacteriales bacterium]
MLSQLKKLRGYIPVVKIPVLETEKEKKRRHREKLDKPPGTLSTPSQESESTEPVKKQLIIFSEDTFSETNEGFSISDVKASSVDENVTWLNIHGLTDLKLIEEIGSLFKLEKLVLEDMLELDQRPKVEEYENYIFFTLKSIRLDENDRVLIEHMSFVLGKGYVISLQEKSADIFEHIRGRLRTPNAIIRTRQEDYLLYLMLDSIVDHYIILLEDLEDRIEDMQRVITATPEKITLAQIEDLKRIFIKLKRSIWPVRDAVAFMTKTSSDKIHDNIKMFYSDLYDLTMTVMDSIESNRQILDGLTNIYLSSQSNRMNEIMKVLTVISAIFVPLTFIAGVYGMNFQYMPELDEPYGYFATWAVMILTTLGLLVFFKKRGWFD